MINVILQFFELDFVNVNVSAKFYQNIPNGLRVKSSLFSELELRQNLDLSQMSFDYLMGLHHVSINVYAKFHHNIPLSSRDRAIFTFSEFEPRQRLGQSQMTFYYLLLITDTAVISLSLGLSNPVVFFVLVNQRKNG